MPETSYAETSTAQIPSYMQFRKHAQFVSALADFALSEKQCRTLLSVAGLYQEGGIGLGDSAILFRSLAIQGYVNYDSFCKVARVLLNRAPRFYSTLDRLGVRHTPARPQSCMLRKSRSMALRESDPDPDLDFLDLREEARSLSPQHVADEQEPPSTSGDAPVTEERTLERTLSLLRTATLTDRERGIESWIGSGGGGKSTTPVSDIMKRISKLRVWDGNLHQHEAPIVMPRLGPQLLREVLQPPRCPYPDVRMKMSIMLELVGNGSTLAARRMISEIRIDWLDTLALELEAVGNRKKKSLASISFTQIPGQPPVPELPSEVELWLGVMACSCYLDGQQYDKALEALERMRASAHMYAVVESHPNIAAVVLAMGVACFYRRSYEDALACFELCEQLSMPVVTLTSAPLATANAAAAFNNRGVVLQTLKRVGPAVEAYKRAIDLLMPIPTASRPTPNILIPQPPPPAPRPTKSPQRKSPPRAQPANQSPTAGPLPPGASAMPPTEAGQPGSPGDQAMPTTPSIKKPPLRAPSAKVNLDDRLKVVISNHRRAVRLSLSASAGGPWSRPSTAPPGGQRTVPTHAQLSGALLRGDRGETESTLGAGNERLVKFLREAIPAAPKVGLTELPPFARRFSSLDTKNKRPPGRSSSSSRGTGSGRKGGKVEAKPADFDAMVYYPYALYNVAHLKLATKKKKKKVDGAS